jgi:hypothetical protein
MFATFFTASSGSSNNVGHRQSIIANVTVKDDSMLVVVMPILMEVVL